MKTFKILTVIVLVFGLYAGSYSQVHIDFLNESKTRNFKEIVARVEAYYADKDKGRGSGYKQFKRWEYYHSTRLSPDGRVVDVSKRNFDEFYFYQANLTAAPAAELRMVAGDWEAVAPTRYSNIARGYNGGLGRVNTVEVDPDNPNIIYIGTPGGGLWRSTNNGSTWTALTDGLPRIGVSGIAIDYTSPSANRTIYILTGDGDSNDTPSIGVLKSTDNGRTWYSTGLTGDDLFRSYKLRMHPTNPAILYVADYNGVFKTTDGGLSWTNTTLSVDTRFFDIEFKPGDPDHMYTSTNDKIYFSTNGGNSWTASTFSVRAGTSRIELAVTPANANYVYAVFGEAWWSGSTYGFNGLYRSTNSGVSFTQRSDTPNILGYSSVGSDDRDQAYYDLAIAASPANAEEVHVGGINCWKSVNGGTTWSNTSYWYEPSAGAGNYTHADIHDLEFVGSVLYCGSDGGIYRSTDNAGNWSSISEGVQITQMYRLGLGTGSTTTRSPLYFGAQDNGSNAVKANSSTALHWYGADGMEIVVLPNSRYVLGSIQYGGLQMLTDESGISFVTPSGQSGNWVTPFVTYNSGGITPNNTVYVGYRDVFRQSTAFATGLSSTGWTNISNGNIGTGNCTHIAVAPSNPNYIYVSKYSQLYRTTNLGASWSNITSNLPSGTKHYFTVHPANPNTVYVVTGSYTSGQKVYRTTNGGASWTNISGSLPNVPVNCIVYENGSANGLYVGMDVGVFYRDDHLTDWVPFYHELPNVEITELEIDYVNNKIYAATYGRGAWKSDLYGQSCPSNLTLSQDLDGFKYYTADNLTSTSSVEPFADVSFVAVTSVTLNPGFETLPESAFHAKTDASVCSDGIETAGMRLPVGKTGTYGGPLPGVTKLLSSEPTASEEATNGLYVFPNPTTSAIYLQFELQQKGEVAIDLFDLQGKLILSEDKSVRNQGKTVEKVAVDNIPPGNYLIKVRSGDWSASRKIAILR